MSAKKLYLIIVICLLVNASVSVLGFLFSFQVGMITEVALAIILGGILSRLIAKPLVEIKEEIDKVKEGDFSRRLHFLNSPVKEINDLSISIDSVSMMLKKSFRKINRQKNDQEAIFYSMREGVLLLNYKQEVIRANMSASQIFNVSLTNIRGKSILEVIRSTQLLQAIEKCLSEFEPQELEVDTNDKTILVRTCPIKHSKYKISGTVLVLNDITHLKKLESYRKQFVTNVSHELKTPLTAIQGFVETIIESEEVLTPDKRSEFLNIIHRHTMRLRSIIDDLMTLARLEDKKNSVELQKEDKNIYQILEAAKEACAFKAHNKNIDIHLKGDREIHALVIPGLFEQAVVNLLDNAIKYSGDGTEVFMRVSSDVDSIYIEVEDSGIGIAEKHIERLFERFYRVDKSRSREQGTGGSGIGLSLVKHIMEHHKGKISVESEEGQGSRFILQLTQSKN